mgnify:FL=1
MLKDPKQRRIVLAAAGGGLIAIVAGWLLLQEPLFRMAVHPSGQFATRPAPPAPDYSKAESWEVGRTQLMPGGWKKRWGVDIFFIQLG